MMMTLSLAGVLEPPPDDAHPEVSAVTKASETAINVVALRFRRVPKVESAPETYRAIRDILRRRTKKIMTMQLLSLGTHPTVIVANNTIGGFEGWGVRIGA